MDQFLGFALLWTLCVGLYDFLAWLSFMERFHWILKAAFKYMMIKALFLQLLASFLSFDFGAFPADPVFGL